TIFSLLAFALREVLLAGASRSLLFVAVFVCRQLELVELPLRHVAAGAAAALLPPRVISNDLEFAGAQFEQGLIRSLLGGQRPFERPNRCVVGDLRQSLLSILHQADGLLEAGLRSGISQPLSQSVGLFERRLLRLLEHFAVGLEFVGWLRT